MMKAGGFKRDAKSCYMRFKELYTEYQDAFRHNERSSIRDRQRSSFYYKIHSLFGCRDKVLSYYSEDTQETRNTDIDEEELIEVLLAGMKEIKNLSCHSVPRVPLLQALAQYVDINCHSSGLGLSIHEIWKYLVQVHDAQMESIQQGVEGPLGMDLDGLWLDNPNPVVAFGVQCVPYPKWEIVSEWSLEELEILVDAIVRWEGTSSDSIQTEESLAEDIAQQLQAHGYDKSSDQCKEQWQYMVKTYCHGGYQNFKSQINLVYLYQPSVIKSAIFDPENGLKSQNHQCISKDEKVLDFSGPRDTILTKPTKIQPENSSLDVDLASQGQKENNTEKVTDKIMNSSMNISNGYECLDFVCDTTESSETQLSNNNKICVESNIIRIMLNMQKEQMESTSSPKKQENKYPNDVDCEKLKESNNDESEVCKTLRVKAKVLSISEFPESKIIMCQVQKSGTTPGFKK
ncbi:uncharacterized protein LOC134769354 [Penaeus indicus]|uniref:uncharacterized protein LOC134769354 n=1 Tax=Penaeus indicus TaxID=29960 RepID=UPI00300C508E